MGTMVNPAMVSEEARLQSFSNGWPLSLRARNCNPKKVRLVRLPQI